MFEPELWLLRHAQAVPAHPSLQDELRPLSLVGWQQAEQLASWLEPRLPLNTAIEVSPALRTRQTIEPLKRPYSLAPTIGTSASCEQVLDWLADLTPVPLRLLVGHQPTLGQVLAALTQDAEEALFAPASLWCLKAVAGTWQVVDVRHA